MALAGTPRSSATNSYINNRIAAVELMVIEVVTLSSGKSASKIRMSSSESMATPTLPTSPAARA
jgi:hypothetical protein